jgi:hypothetical protein
MPKVIIVHCPGLQKGKVNMAFFKGTVPHGCVSLRVIAVVSQSLFSPQG